MSTVSIAFESRAWHRHLTMEKTTMKDEIRDHVLALARGMHSNLATTLVAGPCYYRIHLRTNDLIFSRGGDQHTRITIRNNDDEFLGMVNLHTTQVVVDARYNYDQLGYLKVWKDAHLALTLRLNESKELES